MHGAQTSNVSRSVASSPVVSSWLSVRARTSVHSSGLSLVPQIKTGASVVVVVVVVDVVGTGTRLTIPASEHDTLLERAALQLA